jgi:hypothetical protein
MENYLSERSSSNVLGTSIGPHSESLNESLGCD